MGRVRAWLTSIAAPCLPGKTLATLREGLLRLADDSLAGAGSAKAMRGAYTFPARLSAKGSENG